MSDTALAVRDDTGVGILDRLTSFLGRFLGQENVEKLLPNKNVRIVLFDNNDGISEIIYNSHY